MNALSSSGQGHAAVGVILAGFIAASAQNLADTADQLARLVGRFTLTAQRRRGGSSAGG